MENSRNNNRIVTKMTNCYRQTNILEIDSVRELPPQCQRESKASNEPLIQDNLSSDRVD